MPYFYIDLSGPSSLHRLLPQRGAEAGGSKVPRRRSTSFRTATNEKPPLSGRPKLSWRVSADRQSIDEATSPPQSQTEHSAQQMLPSVSRSADSESKSNLSSTSDLSDSYKTAKNSRSQSVDKTIVDHLKANDLEKQTLSRNTLRAGNSWSDLSEVSQSSDNSKSRSYETQGVKGRPQRRSFIESSPSPSARTSSSTLNIARPTVSLSESRLSNSNSSLSKYSDSMLSESTVPSRHQRFDMDKLKVDSGAGGARSGGSLSNVSRHRKSSYVDSDFYSSSYLKYPSSSLSRLEMSPSRSLGRSLTRRHSTRDSYNTHALRERISPEDIEKFRKDFRRGFRGANSDTSSQKSDEPKNDSQENLMSPSSENPVDEEVVRGAESTTNEEANVMTEQEENLAPGVNEEEVMSYVKPEDPTSSLSNSNLPLKPSRIAQRPKSLCIPLNSDYDAAITDLATRFDSKGNVKANPSNSNNNLTIMNKSRIPNYKRTLSLVDKSNNNNKFEEGFSRERKYSYSGLTPDRSVLKKFFTDEYKQLKDGNGNEETLQHDDVDNTKPRVRKVSRFLRPDFYDTPLEESAYCKKEKRESVAMSDKAPKKLSEKIMSVIKTLRESSHGVKESDVINSESTLIKRAVSLDDVTSGPPKKQRAKRSSSVSYEQHSEALKTIQKFIQKKKASVNKPEKPKKISAKKSVDSNGIRKEGVFQNGGGSLKSVSDNCLLGLSDSTVNSSSSSTLKKTEISSVDQTGENNVEATRSPRALRIARLERLNLSRTDCSVATALWPSQHLEDGSSCVVSPADDNSDTFSTSSDYLDARDFTSPIPSGEETVSERIRRKSFYSRFNQMRKKSLQQVQHSKSNVITFTSSPNSPPIPTTAASNSKSRLPTYRRSLSTAADYINYNFNTSNSNSNINNNNNNTNPSENNDN